MRFTLLRYTVFAAFVLAVLLATGSWALSTRRISPFSALAQTIRRLTDPIINPLETWLVRRGRNPQSAPWWLVGIALVGGIVLITLVEWLAFQASGVAAVSRGGPRGVIRMLVLYAGQLVLLAILVRVIASWFGAGRYNRWVRPAYVLSDWIVNPLRRIIPPLGMIDITPIVAWFAVQILLSVVMRIL